MSKKSKNEVKLLPGFFDRENPVLSFTLNGEKCVTLRSEPLDEEPDELYWNGFIYCDETETNLTAESLTDDEHFHRQYLENMEKIRNLEIVLNMDDMMDNEDDGNDLPF